MQAIISGIDHYLPEQRLTNEDLEKMVNTSDEWITTRTGIKERRILDKDKGSSFMAYHAAKNLLESKNMDPDELDLIIIATVTPDMPVPITAAFVQHLLGAKKCWGFDINAGCCSFIFSLISACKFIESGSHKKVMVIGSDKMSSIMNYEDRNTCIIFGDAAAAVLLEPSEDENLGILDYIHHIDGSGANNIIVPGGGSLYPATHETVDKKIHFVHQEGRIVYKSAVRGMGNVTTEILEKNNLTADDVTLLVPHQANKRIIDATAKRVGLDPDKVAINIDKYGNTTSASIPLAMSEAYIDKRIKKGDYIVLSAFGAGYTWGSILLRWAL